MSPPTFLLVALLSLTVNAQVKTCFYFGGESSVDFPCDPEAETSACCGGGWICKTNLYCESVDDGKRYTGSCTDSSWDTNNNPACPFAYDYEPLTAGYDLFDYEYNVTRCTDTNPQTLCPVYDLARGRTPKTNNTCCENHQGITEINYQNNEPLPANKADLSSYYALAGKTIPTDGVYKPATSSSSSTSSTATAAAITNAPTTGANAVSSPNPEPSPSSGLSTGAKAGIGIGVAVGVLAVAGAAIFLLLRRRKSVKHEREQPAMSNYPQYSNVPQEVGPGDQQSSAGYYGHKSSELPDEPVRMELDSQEYGAGNKRASEMPG